MPFTDEEHLIAMRSVVEHDGVRYVVSTTNNRGWETAIFPAKANGEADFTSDALFCEAYWEEEQAKEGHFNAVRNWKPIWLER